MLKMGYSSLVHALILLLIGVGTYIAGQRQHAGNNIIASPLHWRQCFDFTSCKIYTYANYGRSGNKIIQIFNVEGDLHRCSGASVNPAITDNVVNIPSISFFGHHACNVNLASLDDLEQFLCNLNDRCELVQLETLRLAHSNRTCDFRNNFTKLTFNVLPSWLVVDLKWWRYPLGRSTIVMHFRGGDVFRQNPPPHSGYTQGVCRHFLSSYTHSRAYWAILAAEDLRNPCVMYVQKHLGVRVTLLLNTNCSSVCAVTLLARARIVVLSGVSTFAAAAISALPPPIDGKVIYRPYCQTCPQLRNHVQSMCTSTNKTGMFPWKASPAQLRIMLTSPASMVTNCSKHTVTG